MDQWLIRTVDNWIAGPYPGEQIRQMILGGQLGLQDEVCVANSYWVYIHETDEIQNLLGIEVPKSLSTETEEVTETETALNPSQCISGVDSESGAIDQKKIFAPDPTKGVQTSGIIQGSVTSSQTMGAVEIVGGSLKGSWVSVLKWFLAGAAVLMSVAALVHWFSHTH